MPASLEKVLNEMKAQGYDLGEAGDSLDGEALVAALKVCPRKEREGWRGGIGCRRVFNLPKDKDATAVSSLL